MIQNKSRIENQLGESETDREKLKQKLKECETTKGEAEEED